jgi:hypothetical protein
MALRHRYTLKSVLVILNEAKSKDLYCFGLGYVVSPIRNFTDFRTSAADNGFSAGNRSVPLLVS